MVATITDIVPAETTTATTTVTAPAGTTTAIAPAETITAIVPATGTDTARAPYRLLTHTTDGTTCIGDAPHAPGVLLQGHSIAPYLLL